MGTRGAREDLVEVELVEGDDHDDDVAAGRGRGRRVPWHPVTHLRSAVVLALVAVLTLVGLQVLRVGAVPVVTGGAPDLVVPLDETWRVPVRGDVSVAGDLLLATSGRAGRGEVTAWHLPTGLLRWSATVAAPGGLRCEGSVGGRSGPVVVCTARGTAAASRAAGSDSGPRLLLLDAEDGSVRADVVLPPRHAGTATVDGDLLLATAGAVAVTVTRWDTVEGARRWQTELPWDGRLWRRDVQLAVDGGTVVLTGAVTALLSATDGRPVARRDAATIVPRPLDLLGSTAVPALAVQRWGSGTTVAPHGVGMVRGRLRDLHTAWYPHDGGPRRDVPGLLREPVLSDGSHPDVVLSVLWAGRSLRGLDARSGAALWSRDLNGAVPLLRAGGAVVLAGPAGLRSVSVTDGSVRWSVPADDAGRAQPVTDGRVLLALAGVPGEDQQVVAVGLDDGRQRWTAPLPAGVRSLRVAGGVVLGVGPGVVVRLA